MPVSSADPLDVPTLDAGSRALLDLSLRQGVPDDEIARVLATDTAEVARRRARAMEQVAEAYAAAPTAEVRPVPLGALSPLPVGPRLAPDDPEA
jgi:hypothetical protein